MKIAKWLIGIVVSLFVFVVLAIILLVNFVNPNDYREEINRVISDKIHKPFAIHGDISWVLFPSVGFKAQNMSVGNHTAKDLYVTLNSLEINLQLLPLLHKNIILNALHIDGAQILLPSDEAGGASSVDASTQESSNPAAIIFAIPQLALKSLSIKNTNIVKQKSNGTPLWQITNLSEELKSMAVGQSFPEMADFIFNYPEKNIAAKIHFKTDMKIDLQAQSLNLFSPQLSVENAGDDLFGGAVNLTMKKLTADFITQKLSFEKFSGDVNQLNFSGDATVDHFLDNPIAQGSLYLNSDHLNKVFNAFHITLPKMQSESALSKCSLQTDFQYGDNQLQANPLTIQLDQATIKGSVVSADLKNFALEVNLAMAHFNLGDYLKASDPLDAKQINLIDSQVAFKLLPPVGAEESWLASTVSGRLTIKKLTVNDQAFSNLSLLLEAKNKIFKIITLHGEAWQGVLDASALVNLQGNAPQFTISPQIKNMEIKNLIALLEPKFKLSGLTNLSGSVSSEGSNVQAIKRNLNGHLNVRVNNGVLHGIDAAYWIKAAQSVLHKALPSLQRASDPTTDFGTLTATLLINQGVVRNSDLVMAGPTLHVAGQGTINLPSELLNYHLFLSKTNEETHQAQNDKIPLVVTGNFDHPNIGLDMDALTRQVVRQTFDQQKDKVLQKILSTEGAQHAGQQLSDTLGKLFHTS